MIFTLNLSNEITYKESDIHFDDIYAYPAGSETCFAYRFFLNDVLLEKELLWSGSRAPLSKREKDIVEAGFPLGPREEETLSIPAGKYQMMQTIPVEKSSQLDSIVLPFIAQNGDSVVFIRFFRENEIETVMQLFFPIQG